MKSLKVIINWEEKEVVFELADRAFSVYDTGVKDYRIIGGEYEISAAASSRDIRVSTTVSVDDDDRFIPQITKNTVFEDLFVDKRYPKEIVDELVKTLIPSAEEDTGEGLNFEAMRRQNGYVLRQKITAVASVDDCDALERLVEEINAKIREYYGK